MEKFETITGTGRAITRTYRNHRYITVSSCYISILGVVRINDYIGHWQSDNEHHYLTSSFGNREAFLQKASLHTTIVMRQFRQIVGIKRKRFVMATDVWMLAKVKSNLRTAWSDYFSSLLKREPPDSGRATTIASENQGRGNTLKFFFYEEKGPASMGSVTRKTLRLNKVVFPFSTFRWKSVTHCTPNSSTDV